MEKLFKSLLLSFFLIILTLTGCDLFKSSQDEPEEFGKVGCYAASYNTGSNYGQSIGTTLNDPYYDQKMNEEVTIQRSFFNGIQSAVWILNEGDPRYKNAYASPDRNILFGYHMFYYIVGNHNELAVAGVLAHEWGHQTQFDFGWFQQNNSITELEADAFSGYYMGLVKQWAWSQIEGYYSHTYASGDYNFNTPSHHGTPDQRLAAAYLGVNTAIQAIQNNQPYSYQELHQIFSQQIAKRILQEGIPSVSSNKTTGGGKSSFLKDLDLEGIASGISKGKGFSYNRVLSEEDILHLRPYSE